MKQAYRYTLVDPTKNYTLLVDTSVDPAQQPAVAAALMQAEPLAEQVGFLSEKGENTVGLRMAGGEFCGNAAMSAAVLHAAENRLQNADIAVRFSGVRTSVRVRVQKRADATWTGTVCMPTPEAVSAVVFSDGYRLPVVSFAGIAHVIMQKKMDRAQAESLAPKWCAALQAQAIGIMQLDRAENRLTPLVYVPSADTLFWENSCASGTAAVGYFLFSQTGKPLHSVFHEPGGTLEISVNEDGVLNLTGAVNVVRQREIVLGT